SPIAVVTLCIPSSLGGYWPKHKSTNNDSKRRPNAALHKTLFTSSRQITWQLLEKLIMTARIADTASVDSAAEIDVDVEIGPFCVIGPNVRIKSGTRLLNSVTLMGHVSIGHDNVIYPNTVIGGEPQDISYAGSDTQ